MCVGNLHANISAPFRKTAITFDIELQFFFIIPNGGQNLFITENIHSDSSLTYIIWHSLRFPNTEIIYSLRREVGGGDCTVAFVMKNSITFSIIHPIIYQLLQYSRLFILWEITCSSIQHHSYSSLCLAFRDHCSVRVDIYPKQKILYACLWCWMTFLFSLTHSHIHTHTHRLNTLRTGDADLRFCITTV